MSQLRIVAGPTACRPGAPFSGRVSWRVADQPSAAELRLFWYTSGQGTQDIGVVETVAFASPRQEDERDFTFQLPREPYSFRGTAISLTWALELLVEPGGHVERLEFSLSSTGQPAILGSAR
jgi:hypothetical protein